MWRLPRDGIQSAVHGASGLELERYQHTGVSSGEFRGNWDVEHGLTHRDLKLNNVLISSSGQAKLVDFGLAAMDEVLVDDALADLPNTRTIDYAALERATGVRKDDTRSDIYFLGCIFYHMLTGQSPLSETKDRLQRLSKQRFLDVIPDPERRSLAAALGDAGGQQGDDARPQPSLPIALGALGRPAHRRNATGCWPERLRARVGHGAGRKTGLRHGRRIEPAHAGPLPQCVQAGGLPGAGD